MSQGVPGFYETTNIAVRAELVAQYRLRWIIANQLMGALGAALPAVAFGLLLGYLRKHGAAPWQAASGAVAFALGSMAALLLLYVRQIDLVGFFAGRFPDYHAFTDAFWLAALLFLGISFLQAGLPAWLAYFTTGLVPILLTVWLLIPAGFAIVPFPILLFLVPAIGIVLWKR
jgi:hypothetical protein